MLRLGSSLNGYGVEASDGPMGKVHDILFDDVTWKMRWLVIDFGDFLHRRRGLIHPTSIGMIDDVGGGVQVRLARATISAAPDNLLVEPVSVQMEARLYEYYDCDPAWGSSTFAAARTTASGAQGQGTDPRLRSINEITGCHAHATDGDIGHIQGVLIEDSDWLINYLIIDTRKWLTGRHVLISPHAIQQFAFDTKRVMLNVSKQQILSSPPWKPSQLIDEAYQEELHGHYEWPSAR